jgi:hypothetical protein
MFLKIKIFIGLSLLIGGFFIFRKKEPKTDKDIDSYTSNQLIARKNAVIIKSALNVQTSFWGWTEDEETVIKILNDHYSIQNLIAIEYKKLTNNVLMDDLSKYLSSDDLTEINFNKI